MASKTILVVFFLVSLSLLALSPPVSSERDPQKECRQRCHRDLPDERERRFCERRCEEASQREDAWASIFLPKHDPQECERRCQREGAGRSEKWREMCRHRCEEEAGGGGGSSTGNPERECWERCRREGAGRGEKWQEACRRRCEEEAGGSSRQNPERECWERCRQESRDEKQRRRCQRRCEEEAEQRRQTRNPVDPKSECEQLCGQDEQCRRECQRERSREKHEGALATPTKEKEGGEGTKEKRENPYVWRKGEYQTKYKSEGGSCEMLPNLAEKSEILKRLENYRVQKFVANPSTVVVPHHRDADSILYVCNGKGIIGILKEDKQETFDVSEGDITVIPAGTTCFAANTDERQQLCMLTIFNSVSTSPGNVEPFFGIGGEDQESFFQAFSSDILEAAFNEPKDRLKRLFGARKQIIVKASPEQIRELSRSGSEGGVSIWPFTDERGDCHRPYNILKKKPWFSNRRGQIHRADHNDYVPLHHLDVAISFTNITAGSMHTLAMNSRATKIAIVTKGTGYLEMACPHLSSQQKGEQGTRYHKVSAELSPMTTFIEPAGHPSAIVANDDLHIVCFDLNARGNHRYMLAGKNNIYNNLKGVAGELAFGVSSKESKQVLGAQDEEVFVRGPKERREGGRGSGGYEVA